MSATDRLGEWARDDGLIVVMLVSGTVLAIRAYRVATHLVVRHGRRTPSAQARTETSAQALSWMVSAVASSVCGVLAMLRCNIPVSGLIPVASILGLGFGFGAQRIVGDVLAGAFLLAERTFAVGDTIKVSPPGEEKGVSGTVEEVSLRVTRIRTFNGDLVTFPNSELRQVSNTSNGWARVLVDVPVDPRADLDDVVRVIDAVGQAFATSEAWHGRVLEAPKVAGVEGLDADRVVLRVTGKVLPAHRWNASRDLRARIAQALRADESVP